MPVSSTQSVTGVEVSDGQVVRHVYLGAFPEIQAAAAAAGALYWVYDPAAGQFELAASGVIPLTQTAVTNLTNLFFYIFVPETSPGVDTFSLQWVPYFSVSADPITGQSEWFPLTSPQLVQLGVPNLFTIQAPAGAIAVDIVFDPAADPNAFSFFSNIRVILGATA